ncbi:MAG: hypothetical protein HN403_13530 [Rhodospirillales bacterium]|jgi:hypothetical protein|nr:hypothetical protein [Rhodospirillales bacterium]
MKFPGLILMGAQSKLLPPSIPFRFFVAAVVFHIVAWGMMALDADQAAQFVGGPGVILAAIHALTLGVVVMTAIGASFQILPVVTGRPLAAFWPCRLVFWLFAPGTAALVFGFAIIDQTVIVTGATFVVAGLTVFALLVADVLRSTRGMITLITHGWAAMAALLSLAIMGLMLVFDWEYGFLPDHGGMAIAHVVVAVFGFMGMLVLGYSQFMVPMFAMGPSPNEKEVHAAFGLAAAAIVGAAVSAMAGSTNGLLVAAAAGFIGAVLHIRTMGAVLRDGMRKELGLSFVLVKAAWVFLALAIVFGALAMAELDDRLIALFGLVALLGWLLTFLMGILQRIIPFLAAMNAAKEGQTPPTPSAVSSEGPLKIHALGHFLGLALFAAAIILDEGLLILAGAAAGGIGAIAFAWFALDSLRRMRAYGKMTPD